MAQGSNRCRTENATGFIIPSSRRLTASRMPNSSAMPMKCSASAAGQAQVPKRSHSGDPGRHPAGALGRLRRLERRHLRVPDQAAQIRGATHQRQRDDGEQQDGSEDAASRTGEPARLPQADPGKP